LPQASALCPYLAPKPSRALAALLLLAHALSLLAAWLNPLSIWLRLALSAGVLAGGWLALRNWRRPGVAGLRQKPDGHWTLRDGAGADIEASLLGSSLANPWFALLHFRAESRRFDVLVCRDSLPEEAFRRLRVALEITGREAAEAPLNP